MKYKILVLAWLIFPQFVVNSQELTTFCVKNKPIHSVLQRIEKQYHVRFSYQDVILKDTIISFCAEKNNLDSILQKISLKLNLSFKKINQKYYVITFKKGSLNQIQRLQQIVVTNYLTKGISKKGDASIFIKPKKLGVLAGLTEIDVLESLQQLPSVISSNESATGIQIRSAKTDQNTILFNGISMYHKGHLFGMISPFSPNLIDKITLINKGTNPKYDGRVSGVILLETTNKINKKPKLNIGLNALNFDAVITIPILKNKLQTQIGIRRSYTDLFETPTFISYAKKVFQTTKVNNSNQKKFYFEDYSCIVNYHPNKKNKFQLSNIYINNYLNFDINNINSPSFNDNLKIKNYGISGKWSKKWSSKNIQNTTLSFSDYNFKYIHNDSNQIYDKRNQIYDADFNTDFTYHLAKEKSLQFGYNFNYKNVSYAFLQTENGNQFILDTNKDIVKTHAVYLNYTFSLKNYTFSVGSRLNYYQDFNLIKITPRLIVNKPLNNQFKLQATAEIKNQIISLIDETVISDFNLENKLWRLSDNNKFPVIESKHVSFGGIYTKNNWTLDLDLFTKNVTGITALSLGYLNPNNPNFNLGNQKINGIEFYTKKSIYPLSFWLSYSLNDIKSKYKNINNNNYFTASQAIKHQGVFSTSYQNKKLQLAVAWNIRSGKNYTKTTISNGQLLFDKINSSVLPTYHRLDFTTTYSFAFKNKTYGKIGLSIRNLYNKKNVLSKEYYGTNSLTNPIKEYTTYGIGITPNFLLRFWL